MQKGGASSEDLVQEQQPLPNTIQDKELIVDFRKNRSPGRVQLLVPGPVYE